MRRLLHAYLAALGVIFAYDFNALAAMKACCPAHVHGEILCRARLRALEHSDAL
jgi:hypothetical protein